VEAAGLVLGYHGKKELQGGRGELRSHQLFHQLAEHGMTASS
jgi:hypothetical protein